MNWIEQASHSDQIKTEVLSYFDYLDLFQRHPERECRPTFQYLIDMLESFGRNPDKSFKLFEQVHDDAPAVFGQSRIQENIFQNLHNFKEEGFNNKFILLVGPNGSAKSSFIRKFMKGAEIYSSTEEGALYSFSWIFPIDNFIKGSLGLSTKYQHTEVNSFAHLEDKDVTAILPSELRDHPLLLIPLEHRQGMIQELLSGNKDLLDSVKKSYLYKGDLSKRNRMVYDALLKNYKGNHREVLKHIRVERFKISKRYSTGAVTIEPQIHVDAQMQQITIDKRLASLPPSLQSLNLFVMHGEVVMANRGILEYSDLLKRPLDTYKYLLMTMESSSINLHGILTELDIFFAGTSNEIHLAAFKQHPDFNSFKGRFNFIKVPYLLDYKQEEKIYHEQVNGLKERSFFEPFALRALCLFSVMSRLRCPLAKNFEEKKLSRIASEINPIQKALLLSTDMTYPEGIDTEGKQIIKAGLKEILSEFENENLYEGKFGLSPRDVKKIIYDLADLNSNVTFIDVLDYLKDLITKKNDFDFLNMTPQGDFHHPARFLALIKIHALDVVDRELRDSLGLIDDRSYEDYIRKYIGNVTAYIKGEKIKNDITGKYEPFDKFMLSEFETNIALKEDPHKFRSFLISKLGAYSLDHPGKKIVYTAVFPDIVELLQESFRNEQKKVIQSLAKNIVFFGTDSKENQEAQSSSPLSENDRKQINTIIANLSKKYGYSNNGAIALIKYIIKERY